MRKEPGRRVELRVRNHKLYSRENELRTWFVSFRFSKLFGLVFVRVPARGNKERSKRRRKGGKGRMLNRRAAADGSARGASARPTAEAKGTGARGERGASCGKREWSSLYAPDYCLVQQQSGLANWQTIASQRGQQEWKRKGRRRACLGHRSARGLLGPHRSLSHSSLLS